MQNIKRDGKTKQVIADPEIILATEMGILTALKKIRFNPKPFTKKENTINPNQTKLVDFHMEISKKIDEVIAKNEQENKTEEIVEPRTTWTKTPQTPIFKTELETEMPTIDNELFELEMPTNSIIGKELAPEPNIQSQPVFVGPMQTQNTTIFAVGDHSEDKLITTLGRIRVNKEKINSNKKAKAKKKTNKTKAKTSNASTKKAPSKNKAKKEIVTKKAKTENNKEKIKEAKQKKREKDKKLKAKQEIKLAKQKAKEKKKQERLKQMEQRRLEKEKQKKLKEKEKLKAIKAKEREKQKKKELREKSKGEKTSILSFSTKKQPKEKTIKKEIKTTEKKVKTKVELPEDDLVKAFEIIDDLLGKLPDETIEEFAQSDDFEIYEKVVGKYKKK